MPAWIALFFLVPVAMAQSRLSLNCGMDFPGRVGSDYARQFLAEGGRQPIRWSFSGSVPGLGFDSSTGTLRGTPVSAGTFSVSVNATDADGASAFTTCSVRIENTALAEPNCGTLPLGFVGESYSGKLFASGGAGPYRWELRSGNLPGLTLRPDGSVTGKPSSEGAFPFVAIVTDSGSSFEQARTVACQIRVNSAKR